MIAYGILGGRTLSRIFAKCYIGLVRCIPPIILLFIVYYGLPYLSEQIFHKNMNHWNAMYYAMIALGILHGAQFAEMMRGAYLTISQGQKEAALAIGLSSWQAFYRIIFPQAFIVAIPVLGNAVVGMLKDGALAYSIGVIDITGRAQYLINMNMGGYVMETYLAIALIYWGLSLGIQKTFTILENRMRKG